MHGSEKLLSLCEKIFKKMNEFYITLSDSCTGFNFSYSPRSSWEAMPNVLLLTHHPAPYRNEKPQPQPVTLWPTENDFFIPDLWEKPLFAKRILTIAAEIASCKEGIEYQPSMKNTTELQRFVNTHMVLASFVPFRTPEPTKEQKIFSQEEYWCPILELWQPALIIAAGDEALDGTGKVLAQLGWNVHTLLDESTSAFGTRKNKEILPSNGKYKIHVCTKESSGKPIYILGVPSASANFGSKAHHKSANYGYPDARLYVPNKAPIQDFIAKALFYIEMQRHG